MAIDIRGLGNEAALAQIARLAYGSGSSEGIGGGRGNIGLLDGRVVKFNTHWRERGGTASAEMRASCNELRAKLSEIATAMLSASPNASERERASLDKALAKVRSQLGMDATGHEVATTKLLDRKVVAKVLNVIRDAKNVDVWQELRNGDAASLASKGVDTTFATVSEGVRIADEVKAAVQGALGEIARPANGKPGVALGEKATKFLTDLIVRDLEARRASGLEAQTADEIGRELRDFTSPYLIVTLQTFNLSSAVLSHAHAKVSLAETMGATVVGSPREQRADRADVALAFHQHCKDRIYGSFALALVAEKMPQMRQIQPHGRLTGATVWKACFGESAPKAAGALGSQAFVKAFVQRLNALTVTLTAKHGTGAIKGQGLTIDQLLNKDPVVGSSLFNGASFTSAVRKGVKDPTFVPDVSRDYVAAPPLYPVQDALVKTEEDLESILVADFKRNFPVVTTACGAAEETADFRPFEGRNLSDEQHLGNVRGFVAQMDRVFGDLMTPAQRSVALIGLTQAGYAPFTALLGIGGEHSQAHVDVRREEDGAITLTYASLPDNPVEAQYSYRIEPDGTNYRVGAFISRMRPQPAE